MQIRFLLKFWMRILEFTPVINTGLTQPIGLVFLGPSDMLVLEKGSGQVKRVINGVLQANAVLDLAVNSASERGLLSLRASSSIPSYSLGLCAVDGE